MGEIGVDAGCFADRVAALFPNADLAGLTVQRYELCGGPVVTLAYLGDLLSVSDLHDLVLQPLTRGIPDVPPPDLVKRALFPAPFAHTFTSWAEVLGHLLAGRILIHVAGHPGAVALSSGEGVRAGEAFDADLDRNRAQLRRYLPDRALQSAGGVGANGVRAYVLYLADRANGQTVRQVAEWAERLSFHLKPLPLWRMLLDLIQLPKTVECRSPAQAAYYLRSGYVAVLVDQLPVTQMAPITLELLLGGPHDVSLTPGTRRALMVPRVLAVADALLLGALLVAVTSYHHAVLAGPLLVVLASGRQNLPLPMLLEVIFIGFVDDAITSAIMQWAGRQWSFLAIVVTTLFGLTALHCGLMSPVTVMIGAASSLVLQMLPTHTLTVRLRIWRVFFVLAGAALGMFGIALLLFLLVAYLADLKRFGHRLREKLGGVYR